MIDCSAYVAYVEGPDVFDDDVSSSRYIGSRADLSDAPSLIKQKDYSVGVSGDLPYRAYRIPYDSVEDLFASIYSDLGISSSDLSQFGWNSVSTIIPGTIYSQSWYWVQPKLDDGSFSSQAYLYHVFGGPGPDSGIADLVRQDYNTPAFFIVDTQFQPSSFDFPDGPLNFLYSFGVYLSKASNVVNDVLNFNVGDYSFLYVLCGSGFLVYCGWVVIKWLVGLG